MNAVANDTKVVATGLRFPEGPAFAPDGSLWAVELKAGSLVRYHNGSLQRFDVGGAPNGIAFDRDGLLWFCDAGGNAIRCFDATTGDVKTVITQVDNEPLNKPNDLVFDEKGNLLFTCPGDSRKEPTGYACVLMKNGTVKKITTGKYFPNGLAFTPDGKSLVIAETYRHRLWKGEWNAERGEWKAERVWCNVGGPDGPGGPDGMAFDQAGRLYVAVYGTGSIRVVNASGDVIEDIPLPGQNPTNCAFASSGTLVVTEAERGELLELTVRGKSGQS